jgi:predicted nucleotide-binding protein (sugar kinase/HSP70/actin superfamily)
MKKRKLLKKINYYERHKKSILKIFETYENHLICTGGMKRIITLSKQINKFIRSISQLPLLYSFICILNLFKTIPTIKMKYQ